MVYAHMRYSDKPYMGSVTAAERAEDTVAMSKILFGDDFIDPETGSEKTVVINLINANSPMTFDDTMLGAAEVYAKANQATVVSPFILAGAMSPVTVVGTVTQILAEALVPFRSGGGLNASKLPDAQAAFEAANTLQAAMLAGVNFMLHTAGWLEGGLVMSYEKFMLDADQAGMLQVFGEGVDFTDNGQALDALREVAQRNFETAFYRSDLADNNSFEQWESEGEMDAAVRANVKMKSMLNSYELPPIDPAVDEALLAYMEQRKSSFPDANY